MERPLRGCPGHRARGVTVLTAIAATAMLTACSSGSGGAASGEAQSSSNQVATDSQDGRIVYAGFGGSYEDSIKGALFDPFTADTGIGVDYDTSGSDVAKLTEMVKSDTVTIDLIDAEDSTLAQFINADVLEPLGEDSVDTSGLSDSARELVTDYSVPWYQFSRNIFWNADEVPGGFTSWADVWDTTAHPGKRAFSNLPWGTLEVALLADGVAPEDIYPLDVDRAFKSLDRIRDDAVFFSSGGETQNAIAQGEVVGGYINLARLKSVEAEGAVNVGYSWNGAIVSTQQLVIPKGAPNKDGALKAISASLGEDSQKAILDSLGYTPTVSSVLDGLTSEERADLPGTPETDATAVHIDVQWWAQNGAAVLDRWNSWLNG